MNFLMNQLFVGKLFVGKLFVGKLLTTFDRYKISLLHTKFLSR